MHNAKPNALSRALLAGFISSTVMLYVFGTAFWLSTFSLRYLGVGDNKVTEWTRHLVYNMLVTHIHTAMTGAIIFHLVVGLAWAVVYAFLVEPVLSGPGWRRGLIFALIPWLASIFLFFPAMGAGLLGAHLGAGPLPVIGNLILHLCYGFTLGLAYSPVGDSLMDADTDHQHMPMEAAAMTMSTRRAAQGLVIGLIVGGLTGISVSSSAMSGSFVLMVAMFMGAGLGCLVGAFVGLPTGVTRDRSHQRQSH